MLNRGVWLSAVLLVVCYVLISCGSGGGGGTTSQNPTLQSIAVSPGSMTVAAGLSQQYSATGKYSDGSSKALSSVSWTTSDPTLATVDATGLVTTLKQGSVTITASSGTVNGSAPLTVGPPNVLTLSISPQSASVAAGLTQQFMASGTFTDGSSGPVSSGLTWSTSDPTVAKVSASGLATTLKQGIVTVTAASGKINSNAVVLTVDPPKIATLSLSPQTAAVSAGYTQPLTATGTFTDGTSGVVTGTVTWTVSDPTVATISAGLVRTLIQGTITITASSQGVESNAVSLTVGPPVPVSFEIVPGNDKVVIGASPSTKLSAILTYSDHSTQDLSCTATWTNTNSFAASIDASGNITPLRPGYTSVSATSGTNSASTGFTVISEPRYLYFGSNASRSLSKGIIDANSGHVRLTGYIQTGAINPEVAPCPTIDPSNHSLYMGTAVGTSSLTGELQSYGIDQASGTLSPLSGSPAAESTPVGCIDFEPTGKFAFAASQASNGSSSATNPLLTFQRDPTTGALTLVTMTTVPGLPTRPAIDPLGQYLYFSAFSNGAATVNGFAYQIDASTGALTPITGTPFPLSNLAGTFTFHPSGNYLYMANGGGYSIDTYSVARSTGALTLAGTIQTCINPTPLRFSPDGAFAYTSCSMDIAHDANSTSIETFAVGANGSLTHLASTRTAMLAADVTVDSSGQFLYLSTIFPDILVSNIGAAGVAQAARSLGVQPDSSLSNVVLGGPAPVKFTPKYAFVASSGDNTLLTYGVNLDGTFTAAPLSTTTLNFSSPFSLSLWPWGSELVLAGSSGTSTNHMEFFSLALGLPPLYGGHFDRAGMAGGAAIDSSGSSVFQTDWANGTIYGYEPASPGGWYWPGNTTAVGAGAGPIVTDPAAHLVYVADTTGGSITGYQYWVYGTELFNNSNQAGGSQYPVGANPLFLAIDPNEAYLYALCDDRSLRVFTITYSGGAITQAASTTLPGNPTGLTVEPAGRFLYTSDSTGVSAFSVNVATGALTAIPLSPAITLADTTGIFAEPAGQYLYVTTGAQNVPGTVYGYVINADGTLAALPANPLATPNLPTSMAFSDDIH